MTGAAEVRIITVASDLAREIVGIYWPIKHKLSNAIANRGIAE